MNKIQAIVVGMALAGITIIAAMFLPYRMKADLFAILLSVIAAIYIGFALNDNDTKNIKTEIVAASVFIALALIGKWTSICIIGIAFILHGIWDILHHTRYLKTKIPHYYAGLCIGYDILIGIYALTIENPANKAL